MYNPVKHLKYQESHHLQILEMSHHLLLKEHHPQRMILLISSQTEFFQQASHIQHKNLPIPDYPLQSLPLSVVHLQYLRD